MLVKPSTGLYVLTNIYTEFTVKFTSLKCTWYFQISSLTYHYSIFIFSLKLGDSRFDIFCRRWWYRALSLQLTCHRWQRGCRLYDLLFSVLNQQNIHTDFTSLKCTWYFECLICYAWIRSLPYIIKALFPFLIESMGSSSWQLFRRWRHRDLSLWQIAVPPAWRSFVFRCSINMIFIPDFTVIST